MINLGSVLRAKDKAFSDVRKFESGEKLREGWADDFKVALSTQKPEMKKTLEDVENYQAFWTPVRPSAWTGRDRRS